MATHWESQVSLMVGYIRGLIRELRRDGVTGMSLANIVAIVPTKNISVHPTAFYRLVEDAIKAGNFGSFVTGDR